MRPACSKTSQACATPASDPYKTLSDFTVPSPPQAGSRMTLPAAPHIESGLLFREGFHDAWGAKPGQGGSRITKSVLRIHVISSHDLF